MRLLRIALLSLGLALSTAALAQDRPEDDRGTEFQPVRGGPRETVRGGRLLVIAYAIVWVVVFGYVGVQWRRQGKLREDLQRVEKAIEASKRKE